MSGFSNIQSRTMPGGALPAVNLSAAALNAMSASVAVLDDAGLVVGVNQSWRDVASDNGGDVTGYVGMSYLEVCRRALAMEPEVEEIINGLQDVLAGKADRFITEYRCDRPGGPHWYKMIVTPMPKQHGGVAVVHEDITERQLAVIAKHREQQLMQTVLNTSASAIVVFDGKGQTRVVSRSATELFGLSEDALVGKGFDDPVWSLGDVEGRLMPVDRHPVARAMRGKRAISQQRLTFMPNGALPRQLSVNVAPVLDGQGQIELVVVTVRDITEQLQAEAALQRRLEIEAFLSEVSRLFNRSTSRELDEAVGEALAQLGGFLRADRVCVFEYGDALRELTQTYEWCGKGVPSRRKAMQQRSTLEFSWGVSKLRNYEPLRVNDVQHLPQSASAEQSHWTDVQVRATLAVPVIVSDRLLGALSVDMATMPRQWQDEELTLLNAMARVLGHALERKRIEEQAWTERNLNAAILDSAGTLVCVLDTEMRIVRFNRACERVTGYRLAEVRGRRFDELLLATEERSSVLHVLSEALEGRFPITHENDWLTRDGQRRRIRWYNNAIFGEQGKVAYIVGVGVEVTGQRRAEAALRQRLDVENLLSGIIARFNRLQPHEVHDAIGATLAEVGRFIDASHSCVLLHTPRRQALSMQHEWCGQGVRPVQVHSQHLPVEGASKFMEQLAAKQPWFEGGLRAREGGALPLSPVLRRLDMDAAIIAPMVVADRVLGCVCVGFHTTESGEACDSLMLNSVAMSVAYAIERAQVDAALRAAEQRQRVLLSGIPDPIYRLARDGEVLDVEADQHAGMLMSPESMIGLNISQVLGGEAGLVIKHAILEALQTDEPTTLTYRISADGDSFDFETRLLAAGPDEVLAIERDITQKQRAEEEARTRRQELMQVSRLATVGEMAAGLAHEMNQPLAAIVNYARGSLRILDQNGNQPQRLLQPLQNIAAQAERAGRVIQNIRRFVAKNEVRRAEAGVNDVIVRAINFVHSDTDSSGVELATDLDAHLPLVLLDAILIEQVVVNLVLNAIDAMAGQATSDQRIDVATRCDEQWVYVTVSDSGAGIEAENLPRVFDPFFTTKSDGLGLGLAISKSIVESHEGRIWAESDDGSGARFTFSLPIVGDDENARVSTRHGGSSVAST